MNGDGGRPYAALVTTAFAADASPILLLSQLSEHARNLAADPRVALLFEAASRRRNPQTGPRVTVIGRIARSPDGADRRRFLARHPDAALYADFADFGFYRMAIERAHYVGGFARAYWIRGEDFTLPGSGPAAIAVAEEGVLEHMNADHGEAVALYARAVLGRRGSGWRLTGVDPDGIDLASKDATGRIDFGQVVQDVDALRAALVSLAADARRKE